MWCFQSGSSSFIKGTRLQEGVIVNHKGEGFGRRRILHTVNLALRVWLLPCAGILAGYAVHADTSVPWQSPQKTSDDDHSDEVRIAAVSLSPPASSEEAPSETCTNLALNPSGTGFPSPLESDRGWGGGSYPWEIVDGLRSYSHWAHGLAFTGGHQTSAGGPPWIEPAGWRQATINLGAPKTFGKVIIWHHGVEYTPAEAFLDYWDGSQWVPITFQRVYGTMHEEGQNSGYSDSDIYTFTPVTGSKVRYSFDNSGYNVNGTFNIHGWLYEFEVCGQDGPPPPPAELGHFFCYNAKPAKDAPKFAPRTVSLTDQFETKDFEVKQSAKLCNPADKNGEGIDDPNTHLEGYKLRAVQRASRPNKHKVKVTNQFGDFFVTTTRPDRLLVPTAKSLTNPVDLPNPATHNVDHFKCYRVEKTKGSPKFPAKIQAPVADQFHGFKTYQVKNPTRLCTPVDKNGEGIKDPDAHLMCYRAIRAKGQGKQQPVKGLYVNNQFGPGRLDAMAESELCVPSIKTDLGLVTSVEENTADPDDEEEPEE